MSHFFAYISRLKLIKRWGLMRSTNPENSQEHSWQVATIAHCLVLIKNKLFGGNLDAGKAAVLALYHDVSETITGDLPTPVKYANDEIKNAYHALESEAMHSLKAMLPEDLQSEYEDVLFPEKSEEEELVHIADKICAYIKCAEEVAAGNQEFSVAYAMTGEKLHSYSERPEVAYFIKHFVPSFGLTLDDMRYDQK